MLSNVSKEQLQGFITLTLYDETSDTALKFIRWRAAAMASFRLPRLTSGSAIMRSQGEMSSGCQPRMRSNSVYW